MGFKEAVAALAARVTAHCGRRSEELASGRGATCVLHGPGCGICVIPPAMIRGAQAGGVIARGAEPFQVATRADDSCWTVGLGAVPHALGALPDDCLTCRAKRRQDDAAAQGRDIRDGHCNGFGCPRCTTP